MAVVEFVRAFMALEISEEIRDRIMEVEVNVSSSGADVKLVEKENLHVTMKFLGDVSLETVSKVQAAMEGIKGGSFPIEVRGTGIFPNPRRPRVLWVGVGSGGDRVVSIFRQLDGEVAKLGFRTDREFTPHITIGRVRTPRNQNELLGALDRFKNRVFGSTLIDRIVLKKSVLTSSGPVYSNLWEAELGP